MTDSKLSYTRKKPALNVFRPMQVPTYANVESAKEAGNIHLRPEYSRRDATLSPDIICVISGGTVREQNLFKEIERKQKFNRLKIAFVSSKTAGLPDGGMTPAMMNEYLNKVKSEGCIRLKNQVLPFESIDRVYLVTDVDHYYSELRGILSHLSEENSEKWIISNPAIETWIYYCYLNDPENDLQGIGQVPEQQRSSWLKNRNGTFRNGGGLDPRKAFLTFKDGIRNSLAHYKEDDNGIPELLSTQMHILAQDIVDTLGEEYEIFVNTRTRRPLKKTFSAR